MPDMEQDFPSSHFTFLGGTEPRRDSAETGAGEPRADALAKARDMLASAADDVGLGSNEFAVGRSTAKVNLAMAYMELADRLEAGGA